MFAPPQLIRSERLEATIHTIYCHGTLCIRGSRAHKALYLHAAQASQTHEPSDSFASDVDIMVVGQLRMSHRCAVDFIESLNGRLRDEFFNVNEFATLEGARAVLISWRHDYNHHRSHGSLGHPTPSEFAIEGQKTGAAVPKL